MADRPSPVPSRLLRTAVRAYQRIPRTGVPRCRFSPTCSAYAYEALGEHGAARGSWLAVRRVLRCHPFNPGGHDPVPRRSDARARHPQASARESLT